MPSNADTRGFAYFCQHFPVQQGLSSSPALDVPIHPRGPFGEREPVQLSLHEEAPRQSPSFSYVLGNRNEGIISGSPSPNHGLYDSVVKPFFVNTVHKCIDVGTRLVAKTKIWFLKQAP